MAKLSSDKEPILLIGSGGHARSCIEVIETGGLFRIFGILDNEREIGQKIYGYSVLGTDEMLDHLLGEVQHIVIGIGQLKNSERRERYFYRALNLGYSLPVILASSARVSKHAEIGIGTVVFHGATVNASSKVGICNIINSHALIEHDANIGDFCHISTGVIVNGSSSVGHSCFIGSGTVIVNNVAVADNTFLGAGSVVKKNV